MPYFDASDYTIEHLKAFNAKYNVMIDTEEMFEVLGSLKQGAERIQTVLKDKELDGNQKFDKKTKIQNAIVERYKESYANLLTDVMNQRLNKGEKFDKDKSIGQMFNDFENMMNRLLYKETTVAKTVPMNKIAFGGMSSEEIYALPNNLDFKTKKDDFMKSFNGKSTYDIDQEVRREYVNAIDFDYDNYLSVAQAVQQRNKARGFWGRLFHPIDSRREKNLVEDLGKRAKKLFPEKDFEKDMKTKKPLNSYYSAEKNSLDMVYNDFEDMNLNIEVYNHDKTADLTKEFPTRFLAPEEARHKAEEKYRNEIYPKFQEAYAKGEDLSKLRGDMSAVDFASYKYRFLNEKEEEKAEANYKQNIYPKFKEVYNKNNGDLGSLKEEFKEDFQVMQVKFLKDLKEERANDLQQQEKIDRDFQESLKDNLNENLSIDNTVKINGIINKDAPVVEADENVIEKIGKSQRVV